ncbi:MAG: ATP-binding protein, partial [Chloroflexota bacterium]|nr:ATP-binding protein [Chloroflexota bacterium]
MSNAHQESENEGETAESYIPSVASGNGWQKWLPSDPTSAHWYTLADLRVLVHGHVAEARQGRAVDLPLGRFVRTFEGLKSTAKAKAVADRVSGVRHLSDLAEDDVRLRALWAALRSEAAPVKPDRLGRIGPDHIRARWEQDYGIVGDRFWYHRKAELVDGLPLLVEAAVAETETDGGLTTAINFSPTFADPLAAAFFVGHGGGHSWGVQGFLADANVRSRWADAATRPTAALVHIVHPALGFRDRAKTSIDPTPTLTEAVTVALQRVTKVLWSEGERRQKEARKAERTTRPQRDATKSRRVNLTEACYEVMEQAWAQATGNGTMPASARMVFYQIRPLVQRLTDATLTDSYFTQTVLPGYQRDVGKLPNIYYEPRGILHEPHSGRAVPLGTREVDDYHLPDHVYDKILVVEKKGLWPPLEAARLTDRYDMAVVLTEGFSSVAARTLLSRADAAQAITVFALHDADPSGYDIARTLGEATERMPEHDVTVVDLGLTVEDAIARNLTTETFERTAALSQDLILTPLARTWFEGALAGHKTVNGKRKPFYRGTRVELNALSAPDLIRYIEAGLEQNGATAKVVPPAEVLTAEARERTWGLVRNRLEKVLSSLVDLDAVADQLVADGLAVDNAVVTPETIRETIEQDRSLSWRDAVWTQAVLRVTAAETEIEAAFR